MANALKCTGYDMILRAHEIGTPVGIT